MTLFQVAQRRKAKLRLGIDGPSGSGKTYSALLIAKGLAGGDLAKVALIDTERGSGSLYSDLGPYAVLDFEPPYTVARFVKAHDAAVAEGFEVIVVDSLTHFWSGEGGILDFVDKTAAASTSGNSFAAWKKGTPLQQTFMDTMLASPAHVVATIRSKVEWVIEKNDQGRNAPRKVGLAPDQRKDLEYEFTIMLDLSREHIATASKDRTGLFDERLEVPSEKMGAELRQWLEGGSDAPVLHVAIPADPPPAPKIGKEQATTLKGLMRDVGFTGTEWVDFLEGEFDVDSALKLTGEQATKAIVLLEKVLADKVAAETPAPPNTAPDAPQTGDAPETDDEDPETKAFLEGCAADLGVDDKTPAKSDGMIRPKQLQRLGILCKVLEDNGVMWRAIPPMAGKASRKDLTFEEAQSLIKTVATMAKMFETPKAMAS